MATTPPTELPPMPSEPGRNDPTPTELPPQTPDVDYPDSDPVFEPGAPTDNQPHDTGLTGDFA